MLKRKYNEGGLKVWYSHRDNERKYTYLCWHLCASVKSAIKSSILLLSLKLAPVTPLYKKGKKEMKESHRPVSTISTLSKNF